MQWKQARRLAEAAINIAIQVVIATPIYFILGVLITAGVITLCIIYIPGLVEFIVDQADANIYNEGNVTTEGTIEPFLSLSKREEEIFAEETVVPTATLVPAEQPEPTAIAVSEGCPSDWAPNGVWPEGTIHSTGLYVCCDGSWVRGQTCP